MIRTLLLILLFCFSYATKAELNVMAINAEWLWTPHDNRIDGGKYNKGDMSPFAYHNELNFYASLVHKKSVQILAISEIENEIVADDLAKTFGPDWKAYFKQGRDTATGQDVAIISNLDYVKDSLTDFGFPYGQISGFFDKKKRLSKVVGAQFWVKSGTKQHKVGVITAHFLSKRKDNIKKSQNRQRQSYALVKAMNDFLIDVDKLIVLGDFNDFIESETLSILMRAHNLHSSEIMMGKVNVNQSKKKRMWKIDHILYRNLRATNFLRIDLKKYSDHDAVYTSFSLSE